MEANIYEGKTNFSKFVQLIIDGKEDLIIIKKKGKPVAQIAPICKKIVKDSELQKKKCKVLIFL